MRFYLAVWGGKLAFFILRAVGSGGAALPGLIAERLDPHILARLAKGCSQGVILVAGTNGKTTTSRLLAAALTPSFGAPIHNRSGSNLTRGHIAAFLAECSWSGTVKKSLAILEVDEAVLPQTLATLKPRVVVLHNLFRDQLDRYGEVDSIAKKWLTALKQYPPLQLVINADDPSLAYIGQECGAPSVLYYGVDDPSIGTAQATSAVDVTLSPVSGKPLHYVHYFLSHLGEYRDPSSTFKRPPLTLKATHIGVSPSDTNCRLKSSSEEATLELPLPGLYNLYNALAAATVGKALGVPLSGLVPHFHSVKGVFGRFEQVTTGNTTLNLCLIKNPVGATEVVRTIALDKNLSQLAVFANDNFADGEDVSWYWDSNFELIAPHLKYLLCSGTRAWDMALRCQYAGFSGEIFVEPDPAAALQKLIERSGDTYVLSTYTATLALQHLLVRRSLKAHYWEE